MSARRPFSQSVDGRPIPELSLLAGYEPTFASIPGLVGSQPAAAVRPVYWWAQELNRQGYVVRRVWVGMRSATAGVVLELPSHRVVELIRRPLDTPVVTDLPSLLLEAVWRLSADGWAQELARVNCAAPWAPLAVCEDSIPGLRDQPESLVRVLFWWARRLLGYGWRLEALGEEVARGGFIAWIPEPGGPVLVIYPRLMSHDGTEASALANALYRLSGPQRALLTELVDAAAAEIKAAGATSVKRTGSGGGAAPL